MKSVVFRPEAEADLLAITVIIAESSVPRAKAFVARLRSRCNRLVRHPRWGGRVPSSVKGFAASSSGRM